MAIVVKLATLLSKSHSLAWGERLRGNHSTCNNESPRDQRESSQFAASMPAVSGQVCVSARILKR
jgi:hypothetical protein